MAAILGFAAGSAAAHEAGTTRVVARFHHDGSYAIAITTDASALLTRLEIARKQPRSAPASPEAFQRGFDAFCAEVPNHLAIVFDEQTAKPRAACEVDPADPIAGDSQSAIGVTVTLNGDVPPGAKTFRWEYDLTFASYALTILSASTRADELIWLEGAEKSRALAITRLPAPASRWQIVRTSVRNGFTHILPGGVEQILFVLGLFLLHPRPKRAVGLWSVFAVGQVVALGTVLWGTTISPPAWVHLPIALSIVFVATESLKGNELRPRNPVLILICGLVHGGGVAGVLRDASLPPFQPVGATAGFAMGALLGELAILLTAEILAGPWAYNRCSYRQSVVVPCATALALTGMFWMVQTLML
jgi:hypothetical protein